MKSVINAPSFTIKSADDTSIVVNTFLYNWGKKGFRFTKNPIVEDPATPSIGAQKILTDLLETIRQHCSDHELRIFCVERYNDRYYHDIYRLYYSKKHFQFPDLCGRVFLFDNGRLKRRPNTTEKAEAKNSTDCYQNAFIGAIVRRPLPGREIGRTLIDPRYVLGTSYSDRLSSNVWRNRYHMTLQGIPLSVVAFPFTMQDGEVATCAETTIINMMDYYSQRYSEYKSILPSEIVNIVHNNSNVRNLPSNGLSYEMISRVFVELGFSPILYPFSSTMKATNFLNILHAYVASGIPVALGIEDNDGGDGHSIIIIGTEKRFAGSSSEERKKSFKESTLTYLPNEVNDLWMISKGAFNNAYVVMDDGEKPYTSVSIYQNNDKIVIEYPEDAITKEKRKVVTCFLSPMSGEMTMDAKDVTEKFKTLLMSPEFGYPSFIQKLSEKAEGLNAVDFDMYGMDQTGTSKHVGTDMSNPLMTRIFLCQSKRLKEQRVASYINGNDSEARKKFQDVHLPRFVWVCEIYTKNSYCYKKPFMVGEIIIDATTHSTVNNDYSSIVWVRYPYRYAYRKPDESEALLLKRMDKQIEYAETEWKLISPYRFKDDCSRL